MIFGTLDWLGSRAAAVGNECGNLAILGIFGIMRFENCDPQHFRRGIELFNLGRFFDAHEVLEDIWRPLPREWALRRHVQGMVQLAVAFHHASAGNYLGARSVLQRGLRNLKGADDSFPELDMERLRADMTTWHKYFNDCVGAVEGGGAVPLRASPLPLIHWRG